MAGERAKLYYMVSSKATLTHMKLLRSQNFELWVGGHLIPLIIPFALFWLSVLFPAPSSFYVNCQGYILNIFLPVKVRNGLSKLRSGFVLQLASVCPNKVR